MKNSSNFHQVIYTLSIQAEYKPLSSPVFHGKNETVGGQKFDFRTLAELNGLLCDIAGWIDTPLENEECGTNPKVR
jgi:hypothetical protein